MIIKQRTIQRQTVNIRRMDLIVPVAAQRIKPELICKKQNNIWSFFSLYSYLPPLDQICYLISQPVERCIRNITGTRQVIHDLFFNTGRFIRQHEDPFT